MRSFGQGIKHLVLAVIWLAALICYPPFQLMHPADRPLFYMANNWGDDTWVRVIGESGGALAWRTQPPGKSQRPACVMAFSASGIGGGSRPPLVRREANSAPPFVVRLRALVLGGRALPPELRPSPCGELYT